MRKDANVFTGNFASFPQSKGNSPDKQKENCFRLKVHVNTRNLPRTRVTFMRSGLCALLPLTKRSQCHCLSWLPGTRQLFDSRTRYMLEIRHFPRFFHELSVQKGNATYNTENKLGGRVLSKRKHQDVPNLTDSQRV